MSALPPLAGDALKKTIHLAYVYLCGMRADLRVNSIGLPVIVFPVMPKDAASIRLPDLEAVDYRCSRQMPSVGGRPCRIEDILVASGYCKYETSADFCETLNDNLCTGRFAVAANIPDGFFSQ